MRCPFLAAVSALALLGGCTLIPTYHRPALPVEAGYPNGPAYGSGQRTPGPLAPAWDTGWKDFFADRVLQQLVALSLDNNRDLRVAILNVQSAQASYRASRSSLFPTIDATGDGEYERLPSVFTGGMGTEHVNALELGVGITNYELDVFGKLRSQAEQARQTFLSEAETREATQISLIAQVASEYLAWISDQQAIKVSDATASAYQHSYDLRVLTLQHGSGTAQDVAQAESSWRTAQASQAQYTRQAAEDFDELVLLAGTPILPDLRTQMLARVTLDNEPPFPELPAGLPSDLLQRRPDIRAAEHTLLAANANVGAARAAFFPSVTLTANGGTAGSSFGKLFAGGSATWMLEPNVSVPIFDAGYNFANLDIARAQKRIDIADYEKAIQSAFHDVADSLTARATYTAQVDAERKLVDADQRYYNLATMRFNAGVDNYLDVLVAQNSLFSAQLNLIQLRLQEQQNLVTLYKDLGGGWK